MIFFDGFLIYAFSTSIFTLGHIEHYHAIHMITCILSSYLRMAIEDKCEIR